MKRIEMGWKCGMVQGIFQRACKLARDNNCNNVVFEFNGGKFSVGVDTRWTDEAYKKLMSFPRKDYEVRL